MIGLGPIPSLRLSPDHTPSLTPARVSDYCCHSRINRLLYYTVQMKNTKQTSHSHEYKVTGWIKFDRRSLDIMKVLTTKVMIVRWLLFLATIDSVVTQELYRSYNTTSIDIQLSGVRFCQCTEKLREKSNIVKMLLQF